MGNTVVWKPSQTAILSNWLDLPDPARGRAAGRRDQLRARAIPARSPRSASTTRSSPACTSPARARSSARSSARSASASTATAPIRAWSARRAARTSSSCTPPPTRRPSRRRSCAARSSTRGRSARRPRARTFPDTLWPEVRDRALALVGEIHQGDPTDLTTFMGAVIDGRAFARLRDAFALAEVLDEREHPLRRRLRRQRRLVRRADDHRDERSALRHHGARAVRARA